ncbi:MAG: hypothetical protein L6Q92_07925 [Phycisphaerae bacterium]|nr:hypothetical protein [Phycisphaerae bacterium]
MIGRRWLGGVLLVIALVVAGAAVRGDESRPKPSKSAKPLKVGQRPGESDEAFAKRRALLIRKAQKDKDELYTLRARPFIVRSDISSEFTTDAALYMEMLHREYKLAYRKMSLPAGDVKEWIEVIIFADRATYIRNGGTEGSGGQFMQWIFTDRPPTWPARHYRLMMFTNGVTKFSDWPKGVLKHEAAHMELQLRLGFGVDSPRWWNEGQASCFEDWDFDKSVDENLAEIPKRGRYAPVIRRLHGTKKFKPFAYVWEISPQSWHAAMTDEQGGLNYAQAWSLAAFMLNEGVNGRKAFQQIYGLSKRVGADRQISGTGTKTRAWEVKFPKDEQKKIESQWMAWIEKQLPKDRENPDEWMGLVNMGYDPRLKKLVRLGSYSKEQLAEFSREHKKRTGKSLRGLEEEDEKKSEAQASEDSGEEKEAADDERPKPSPKPKKSTKSKKPSTPADDDSEKKSGDGPSPREY